MHEASTREVPAGCRSIEGLDRLVLADASGAPLLELAAVEDPPAAVPSEMPPETGG